MRAHPDSLDRACLLLDISHACEGDDRDGKVYGVAESGENYLGHQRLKIGELENC